MKERTMTSGVNTIVIPVKDTAGSKAIYAALLGVAPHTDQPYYVGFNAAGQEIGLDPNGQAGGMTMPVPFWQVDDIAAAIARLETAGAEVHEPTREVGGGRTIAIVRDADGNLIGLAHDR
jgi:predicted enzyme related to lactoylglutathione lyase